MKKFIPTNHKSLLVHVFLLETRDPMTGWCVETTDAYIHFIDEKATDMSFMIPWHQIKEVQLFEDVDDDDQS